tara:strand:- start:2454 stop:2696 length:243 start_codon:yes stop_codon:yes gene_type:complete
MAPKYLDQDIVITSNIFSAKINDVVVVRSENHGNILKRVISKNKNAFKLQSDNKSYYSEINDSSILRKDILGKVIFKIRI